MYENQWLQTKFMAAKIVNKDKPCIGDNNESLEIVEIFKYLGPKIPSNHVCMSVVFLTWK